MLLWPDQRVSVSNEWNEQVEKQKNEAFLLPQRLQTYGGDSRETHRRSEGRVDRVTERQDERRAALTALLAA